MALDEYKQKQNLPLLCFPTMGSDDFLQCGLGFLNRLSLPRRTGPAPVLVFWVGGETTFPALHST